MALVVLSEAFLVFCFISLVRPIKYTLGPRGKFSAHRKSLFIFILVSNAVQSSLTGPDWFDHIVGRPSAFTALCKHKVNIQSPETLFPSSLLVPKASHTPSLTQSLSPFTGSLVRAGSHSGQPVASPALV